MQSEAQFRILIVLPWSPLAKWILALNSFPRQFVRQFPRMPVLVRQPHWDYVHPDPQALNLQLWCLEKTGWDRWVSRIKWLVVWNKARATSTRKHYKSQWGLFESWAVKNCMNPLDAGMPLLTQFLEYLFTVRKVGLGTIKNYRSAIAHYWKIICGVWDPGCGSGVKGYIQRFC